MDVLKEKTMGVCSNCYEISPARVLEKEGRVVIEKECHEHGTTSGVLETDSGFFRKLLSSNRKADPNPMPYRCLMINVTHGCNLKCHLCYLPERDTSLDFSLDEIKEIISNYPGYSIALSGGEPTTREDLPEIVRHIVKSKKIAAVITNGVRLADINFVRRLKEAGLGLINISCNGLKEEAFLGIENARLLETKLKALNNIKEVGGIYTQISFTMARGINDDQFGEIIKFALEHNEFIYQIRARVATGIGRNLGEKNIYLSDFVKLLATETGIPYEYILDYWTGNDWYPNPYLFNLEYFNFLLDPQISKRLGFKGTADGVISYLSHHIGEKNALRLINFKEGDYSGAVTHPTFLFVLFSWPDKHNLDYEEVKGLNLDILTRDKKVLNYWDGLIRNEKLNFL